MFVGHTPIKPSIHGVPREGDVEEGIVLAAQAHVKATDELCPAVTVEHREAAGVLAGEHLKFFSVYALFSPIVAAIMVKPCTVLSNKLEYCYFLCVMGTLGVIGYTYHTSNGVLLSRPCLESIKHMYACLFFAQYTFLIGIMLRTGLPMASNVIVPATVLVVVLGWVLKAVSHCDVARNDGARRLGGTQRGEGPETTSLDPADSPEEHPLLDSPEEHPLLASPEEHPLLASPEEHPLLASPGHTTRNLGTFSAIEDV